MTTENIDTEDYCDAKKRIDISVGESVRIMRELQDLSQAQLAALTGLPESIIAAIESDSITLDVQSAKCLARALRCHPGVLLFPGWDIGAESST